MFALQAKASALFPIKLFFPLFYALEGHTLLGTALHLFEINWRPLKIYFERCFLRLLPGNESTHADKESVFFVLCMRGNIIISLKFA